MCIVIDLLGFDNLLINGSSAVHNNKVRLWQHIAQCLLLLQY